MRICSQQLLVLIPAVASLSGCTPPGSLLSASPSSFQVGLEESYRAGLINRSTYEANINPTVAAPTLNPGMVAGPQRTNTEEIPFQVSGKNLYVHVRINGTITIPFILDTGANDLAIPVAVATTLARAGALERSDLLGAGRYSLADGSTQTMPRVVIREVEVGRQTIKNVSATINPAAAEPLLGQSFLARFGTVMIDYRRHLLVLAN